MLREIFFICNLPTKDVMSIMCKIVVEIKAGCHNHDSLGRLMQTQLIKPNLQKKFVSNSYNGANSRCMQY